MDQKPRWLPDIPETIVTTAHGRQVVATRERKKSPPDEPSYGPKFYWVIAVDGERTGAWPATPDDAEASIRELIQQWIDNHPGEFKPRRPASPS